MLGCESILSSLISRSAVIGNFAGLMLAMFYARGRNREAKRKKKKKKKKKKKSLDLCLTPSFSLCMRIFFKATAEVSLLDLAL